MRVNNKDCVGGLYIRSTPALLGPDFQGRGLKITSISYGQGPVDRHGPFVVEPVVIVADSGAILEILTSIKADSVLKVMYRPLQKEGDAVEHEDTIYHPSVVAFQSTWVVFSACSISLGEHLPASLGAADSAQEAA